MSFGNNGSLKVIGVGDIHISECLQIKNVLLVKGMTFNLLSVSQLCDTGYTIEFHSSQCLVKHIDTLDTVLVGTRVDNLSLIHI